MSSIKSKAVSWSMLISILILAMPLLSLAEDSAVPASVKNLKQIREIKNQATVVENMKNNSRQVKASPEQSKALKVSNALKKMEERKTPNLTRSHSIHLKKLAVQLPEFQNSGVREVMYGQGAMSFHPDSTFFNFLTGMNSGDSAGMDIRITSNEGTNFGNEYVNYPNPSLLYFLDPIGSLEHVSEVASIDDPGQAWTDVSWDWQGGGNSGAPLAAGNLWVIHTRTSNLYVVMEVTFALPWNNYFEFNYLIQTDGSTLFNGTPSLVDIKVNGLDSESLEIGSNPYVEIDLGGGTSGEFAVIWDGNQNGDLDDSDFGLNYYEFTDNDMHDEDPTPGIFGVTFSDDMADGLNYLVGDLLFVAFTDMGMDAAPVAFYSVPTSYSVDGAIYIGNGGGPPAAGVVVWASYEWSDQPTVITVTDAGGQYHLDLPDSGLVMVGSEDYFQMTEGLIPVPEYHQVMVIGHELGYNFYYSEPTSAISGFVRDEMGNPISDVEIEAYNEGPSRTAWTDETGYYYMGVMPGEYGVDVRWSSLASPYMIPFSQYVWVENETEATVDFTLYTASSSISGTVYLDGAPWPHREVAAINNSNGYGYSIAFTGADGSYSVPVVNMGGATFDLIAWNGDMNEVMQVSENWNVTAGATGEDIFMETLTGGLYGYFINGATGEPIPNDGEIGMSLYNIENGMGFYSNPAFDGSYEIHVPPGTYELYAGGRTWMPAQIDNLVITDALVMFDIVLFPFTFNASIEGYVYDDNQNPLPYAQIQIGNEFWGDWTETDGSGYYHFELPQGHYYMYVWQTGFYEEWTEVEVYPGTNYQSFYLESYQVDGAIYGIVMNEGGQPIMNAEVYVGSDIEGFMQYTDESGGFWFNLPNGVYDLYTYHWDFMPYFASGIEVENDTTFQQIIMTAPQGGVEGYVYSGDGYPISNAEVVIFSALDSTGLWGYTDYTGYYSIPAYNGEFYISAWADGFNPSQPSALSINDEWVFINIWLEQREFATPPEINYVVDQPYDQGRQVRMQFWPGGTEWGPFMGYSIWRMTNTPMGPIIDFVNYVPFRDLEYYDLVAPTLVDSNAYVSDPLQYTSLFMVTGHWDMWGFIDGIPAPGYSVDNILPGIPGPLTLLSSTEDGVQVGWEASMDDDFQYFQLSRASNPGFTNATVIPTLETVYTDLSVTVGQTYYYKVSTVDANGNLSGSSNIVTTSIVSVDDVQALPTAYGLSQNYPNPFNPTTSIEFALPQASEVSLEIYNLLGQKVRTLISGYVAAGYINTSWDGLDQNGKDLSSGTYIYRLQTGDMSFSKKMVLMK